MTTRGCHCERSEAISNDERSGHRDCFVATLLAMTPTVSVQREAEHLGGVLGGDLAYIFLGRALEDALDEILRARPGRLGMRVVAAPQHVFDADVVAHLDAEVVFHELDKHVAP